MTNHWSRVVHANSPIGYAFPYDDVRPDGEPAVPGAVPGTGPGASTVAVLASTRRTATSRVCARVPPSSRSSLCVTPAAGKFPESRTAANVRRCVGSPCARTIAPAAVRSAGSVESSSRRPTVTRSVVCGFSAAEPPSSADTSSSSFSRCSTGTPVGVAKDPVGEPAVTTPPTGCLDRNAGEAASAVAAIPPRLCPTSTTGSSSVAPAWSRACSTATDTSAASCAMSCRSVAVSNGCVTESPACVPGISTVHDVDPSACSTCSTASVPAGTPAAGRPTIPLPWA
ncbi:beta-1,3-glucanase family protein [Isoptericola sp. NPDC057191]|uniref:beta-1,3-glucanase family protein n=1 Tax=Isoptericola sp. NPDC057191 TaxID=3346041 RepID=UPI003638E704